VWLSFIEDLKKRIIYLDLQNKIWYNIYERLCRIRAKPFFYFEM
jgi:hypothetical protein